VPPFRRDDDHSRGSWFPVGAVVIVGLLIGLSSGVAASDPGRGHPGGVPSEMTAARGTDRHTQAPDDLSVRLSAGADQTFPPVYQVIDRLEPEAVLRVWVHGFEAHAQAHVTQCVHARTVACGNRFPVQFDSDGQAFFQYQIRDDFNPVVNDAGGCRAHAARCTLVVEATPGKQRAEIDTIFADDEPEPGVIRVQPSSGLSDGQRVVVDVAGYPPGVGVTAALCAAPDVTGSRRCGAPGPSAPLVVGADGTGSTTLIIDGAPVGSQHVECGRDVPCGISVTSPTVFARARVRPISFAPPSPAVYDGTRVAIGIAAAVVLLGLAVWFIRGTDWSPVGEAAAPEIDAAEYADLDAMIAALPPESDDAVVDRRR